MDKLAFGRTTNCRIAGLPGDSVEIEGKEGGIQPQASSGDRSLTTGMTTPHDDQVKTFCGGSASAHAFILQCPLTRRPMRVCESS